MAGRIDASGSRVQFLADKQTTFDTPVRPTTRLRLTLPEELKAQRTFDLSEEPTPQRGRADITETTRAASGPLNFEMRTEGLGLVIQAAFGSDEDVATSQFVDGGVRCQVAAKYDPVGTPLQLDVDYIPSGFPQPSGDLVVLHRPGGDASAQLTFTDNHTYDTVTIGGPDTADRFNLNIAPGVLQVLASDVGADDIDVEDYVFLYDASYTGVYTHVYAAGDHLDTVMTYGILRDIVAFYYYSCKTNTYSETYDNQSKITGSFEVFAGDEFFGGVLDADVLADAASITMRDEGNDVDGVAYKSDRRNFDIFYPSGGTIWIGDESGITFTTFTVATGVISGIPTPSPAAGAITENHEGDFGSATVEGQEREVIACASVANVNLTVTDSPLSSFNAGVDFRISGKLGFDVAGFEALSASWELNNNLFTDKIPLGRTDRIALPEGIRDVTLEVEVEFDSPEEYNRVVRGTPTRFEINCVDQVTDIAGTGVRKRHDTIFGKVRWIEDTPTAADTNLITYTLAGRALVGTRWPEVVKIITNSQADNNAGG